ncbi:MAG: SEC-C domain-containing protein [Planctomycetes bacterium]|nr:SEC-C domain-containing protein [Planctomycetota bacterium]
MAERKVSRNGPCPCGSGRKFKKCCGRTARPSGGAASPAHRIDERNTPEHDRPLLAKKLRSLGVDPALIFAFEQTGLMISEENQHQFSEEEVRRFDAALDICHSRRTQITTEALLSCSMEAYIDACAVFNAEQCEQHARKILDRLGEVSFETYLRALTEVALTQPTPGSVDAYYAKTRELFPDVPLADDILGRLAGLMLRMIELRLARHMAQHKHVGSIS